MSCMKLYEIIISLLVTNLHWINIFIVIYPIISLNYKLILLSGLFNIFLILLPINNNIKHVKFIDLLANRHSVKIIFDDENEKYLDNYIFCYHPHGNLSLGFLCCANSYFFHNTVMSISWRALYVPLMRLLFFFRGGVTGVSVSSIRKILNEEKNILLIPGGIHEMVNCKTNGDIFISDKHKGFISLSMKNGYPLVPILCFGENDLYYNLTKNIEKYFYDKCKIILPSIYINKNYIPLSNSDVKLTYIIGKPIIVEKNINAEVNEIAYYHNKYYNYLVFLFEKYKDKLNHNERKLHLISS